MSIEVCFSHPSRMDLEKPYTDGSGEERRLYEEVIVELYIFSDLQECSVFFFFFLFHFLYYPHYPNSTHNPVLLLPTIYLKCCEIFQLH